MLHSDVSAAIFNRKFLIILWLSCFSLLSVAAGKIDERVVEAIRHDDPQEVRRLILEDHANINFLCRFLTPNTPLKWAVKKGEEDLVKIMLEQGCELEENDSECFFYSNKTALDYAREGENYRIVQLLLDAGAKDNINKQLFYAVSDNNIAQVEELLRGDADPNAQVGNRFALEIASENGYVDACKLLLEYGAILYPLNPGDGWEPEPIDIPRLAMKANQLKALEILVKAGAILDRQVWGQSMLDEAIDHFQDDMAEFILAKGGTRGINYQMDTAFEDRNLSEFQRLLIDGSDAASHHWWSMALDYAASFQAAEVKWLLQASSGYFRFEEDQQTSVPLHWALMQTAVDKDSLDALELILIQGVNPNLIGGNGETPLCLAVKKDVQEAAQLLLSFGAEIDLEGSHKQTPLIKACALERWDWVPFLLDSGANPDLTDDKGKTSQEYAKESGRDNIFKVATP